MAKVLTADEFIIKAKSLPVLDVRSPGEYVQGHIPGALSLPRVLMNVTSLISGGVRGIVGK